MRQDEQRSDVQKRVAAELQERLKNGAGDGAEHESTLLENQHQTRHAGIIIGFLIVIIAVVGFFLAMSVS